MQNKYVGDIGDYGKYSLLRALSGADDNESLRLAVVWYLRPDDKKPGGNQTGYLGQPDKYAALDPKVFNSLSKIVKLKRRNVRSVRKARLFPGEPVYFEEWVPANRKLADRREWLERAVTDVAGCDLVFLDPDNGLRLYKGEGLRLEDEPPSSEHVYFDDVTRYLGPDKSVVVIHHATPMLSVDQQIATALAEIDRLVEGSAGTFALRYHRFTPVRLFFVIPADRDRNLLFARAEELCRVHEADFSLHTREQAAGARSKGRPLRIVLTGFSGTGKSLVAPIVAERLGRAYRQAGWRVIEIDSLVERAAGRPILDIFRQEGEERFRELEADALREACNESNVVISTGGGAVLRPDNRRIMAEGGFVVCLEARPETILRRLRDRAEEEPLDRPLLAVADPLKRIRELKAGRQSLYALADWTVQTDGISPEDAADEVVRVWRNLAASAIADPKRVQEMTAVETPSPATTLHAIPDGTSCVVRTASASYPVFVEWGALQDLGRRMREAGLTGRAYIIGDEAVIRHYGKQAEAALAQADIPVASFTVPPGEASKSLETASAIYDWLIEQRAEREHAIVALGGGMVTDLAGFVAATYARGLPLVHVPTSLLAMVDAAIGGKVAVNHPRSKNAIGAFYQPRFVLADVSTLRTLPPREISGWAEAIKHAMILDADLLAFFEEHADAVMRLEPGPTTEAIRRSVAIKATVVSEDEREETGRRTILNYGHTVGHAIEAVTGYERFRHGEADAIGMTAAAAISRRLGLMSADVERRQRALLERFGLPTSAEGLDRGDLLSAMALDKKVRAGAIRWVLLEDVGRTVLRDDVPRRVVEEALDEVLA